MAVNLVNKLDRLNREVDALSTKLFAKLDERQALVDQITAESEQLRAAVNLSLAASHSHTPVSRIPDEQGRRFTDEQIREIRGAYKRGESQSSIARRYGVSQPTIFHIVKRSTYREVA